MFSQRTDWTLAQNRFTQALNQARSAGLKLFDLTASNPTRVGLRYDADAILNSLSRPEILDYDPQPKGMLKAREAVCNYYREQHEGHEVNPENVVLTTSTSEAYAHVFRLLCDPGDEVLVPKPSYPLFEFLAELQDVKLVPYPLLYDHGWQIDFASMYGRINDRTKAVLVVHPNNPTGSYASAQELESLNSMCRKFGLALVVDEVFLDYAFDGAPRESFVCNEGALTFTLSGLSKLSALPQMKIAWLAASGREEELGTAMARLEIIADTFLSMNAPLQLATPVLLDQRRSVQPMLLDRLRLNLEELDRQIGKQTACGRLHAEGGWYSVLRAPAIQTDEELAIHLLDKFQVIVHPGHFYDFPSDGYLILSLIVPPQEFREGLGRVLGYFKE
jgi:alanine-synthesizing transaminase